ncbi:DNA packaging ATPase [Faustovirus]|nr:DNA packaging ATPase [Faustovirus]QJX73539.1 DNA packaging ATPase [Faustovirus]
MDGEIVINDKHWNVKRIFDLYTAKVTDNIFERTYRRVFTKDPPEDRVILDLLYRGTRSEPWILRVETVWWMPTLDKTICISVMNNETPYANVPVIEDRARLLLRMINELAERKHKLLYKLFVRPIIDLYTMEELFGIYVGYSYTYRNYAYDINNPLPLEIELVSRNGYSARMHKYVAVSMGDYLKTRILKDHFKNSEKITLPCDDTTLKWFVAGAYKGAFVFDNDVDNVDAAYTLDYLLIIKKEELFERYFRQLNIWYND